MAARKQYQLLDTGDLAPAFRLTRLEGGEITLTELLPAGPILLVFFKITCPVCQFTLPFLERIHAATTLPIYAISQDDAADTRDFHREFGITIPTLLDAEESGFPVSNDYGISHVPTLYLIGADGRIARVSESWNQQDIESLGALAGVQVIRPGENVPAFRPG
jgi:peroxiredoxin